MSHRVASNSTHRDHEDLNNVNFQGLEQDLSGPRKDRMATAGYRQSEALTSVMCS